MSQEEKPEWSLEETIAKAMCHRSVGDVHAVDINGRQRWNWYIEDAKKFISTYGHKLQHFGAVWDGVSWSVPAAPSTPPAEKNEPIRDDREEYFVRYGLREEDLP